MKGKHSNHTVNTIKKAKRVIFYLCIILFFNSLQFASNAQDVIIPGYFAMPENKTATNAPATTSKSKIKESVRVDLHRFMGYENLPERYLSLPYDTMQHTNVAGTFTDVGFLLQLLLPILFLFPSRKLSDSTVGINIILMLLCSLMLIISISTALLNSHSLNSPTEGINYVVTNPQSGFLGSLSDSINKAMLRLYEPFYSISMQISDASASVTYPLLSLIHI